MAAQDLLGLGELRLASELPRPLQVEHDRRVLEKSRAALHLLGKFGFETGIAQHSGAHHHDGEDRALHEIARHSKYATRPRRFETLRVNPKSCPPQRFWSGTVAEQISDTETHPDQRRSREQQAEYDRAHAG